MAHKLEFHLTLFCYVRPGAFVLGTSDTSLVNQAWTFSPSPSTGAAPIGIGNYSVHQGGRLLGCEGTAVGK